MSDTLEFVFAAGYCQSHTHTYTQYIGIMVWVFSKGLGESGSIPGQVIPKTKKNGTRCLLI